MCTLSFIPGKDGYIAAMNRDELLTRPLALSPEVFTLGDVETIYPREPMGGTWIACNDRGVLLALLNWHEIDAPPSAERQRTRGSVIPALISATDSTEAEARFGRFHLAGLLPFRLIGIFPHKRNVNEWSWDGQRSRSTQIGWSRGHWFSSGFSEPEARSQRGHVCEEAARATLTWDKEWLRELHRSHASAAGPFSVCVHRPDAATVSYTEVHCAPATISMSYTAGNPCGQTGFDSFSVVAMRDLLVHSQSA